MRYEEYFKLSLPSLVNSYIEEIGYQTFYKDAEYCVRKWLGEKVDPLAEERLKKEEYANFLSGVLYRFKENFAQTKEGNLGYTMMHIGEYREEILSYLTHSPFCFMSYPEVCFYKEKNIYLFLFNLYKVPVEKRTDIVFAPAQVEAHIDAFPVVSVGQEEVSLKDVVGSTVSKYAKTSWFEMGEEMRGDLYDKSLWNFLQYVEQNRIFESDYAMKKVMQGVCAEEVDGKIYIAEGNHRITALKVLYLIERSLKDPLETDEKYKVPMHITHRLRLEKEKVR